MQRRGNGKADHHGDAEAHRRFRHGEQGQHIGSQQQPEQQLLRNTHADAGAQGHKAQRTANIIDMLAAHAHLLAHDDGGGRRHAENGHCDHLIHVARHGVGGDQVGAASHVAHDHGVKGSTSPPKGFVQQHRGGELHKAAEHRFAGAEDAAGDQGHPLAAEGVGQGDDELHHTGGEGGDGGAGNAQGGQAQLAEDEDVVAQGVAHRGDGEHRHAEAGVLNALLHPDVDGGEGVENVGKAHDADIGGAQLHQPEVVRDEQQHLPGKQAHGQGADGGDAPGHEEADAHDPVDGLLVTPAPELADEHTGAALQAEDNELNDINGYIGHGDGGHLLLAYQAYHEGVHKAQGGGDQVLQHHRQGQSQDPAVKAGLPAEIAEVHKTKVPI